MSQLLKQQSFECAKCSNNKVSNVSTAQTKFWTNWQLVVVSDLPICCPFVATCGAFGLQTHYTYQARKYSYTEALNATLIICCLIYTSFSTGSSLVYFWFRPLCFAVVMKSIIFVLIVLQDPQRGLIHV